MRSHIVQIVIILQVLCHSPSRGQFPAVENDSAGRVTISGNAGGIFNGEWFITATGYRKTDSTTIDTVIIDNGAEKIRVVADDRLSYFPARIPVIDSIERGLLEGTGGAYEGYAVEVFSDGRNIREYVPNYYRTGIGATSPVGCFPAGASPYGLLDMSGTVWEWTKSHYKKYPYNEKDGREDITAGDNVPRVLRGGAFYNISRNLRCADRDRSDPNYRYRNLGFRVFLSPV